MVHAPALRMYNENILIRLSPTNSQSTVVEIDCG